VTFGPTEQLVVEHLDVDACVELLSQGGIGRIGFVDGGDVTVLPVNFIFDQGCVLFRTSPGSKFDAALHRSRVAFEIDGAGDSGERWSVLVNGVAQEVWDPKELRRIDALSLWSLINRDQGSVVRIAPGQISGRRFRHVTAAVTLRFDKAHQEIES
jgi:nitroimidazol reductase NimA-like FMN-containing flavoprotein (pyridoxamine 5'-phosphate oxidase superfamily)